METTQMTNGNELPTILEVGQFATIDAADNELDRYGFSSGDEVYLAGDAIVNVSADDPYQLRRVFIAARVVDGHVNLDDGGFTFDGLRLTPVDDKRQQELDFIKGVDFGEEDQEVASATETPH